MAFRSLDIGRTALFGQRAQQNCFPFLLATRFLLFTAEITRRSVKACNGWEECTQRGASWIVQRNKDPVSNFPFLYRILLLSCLFFLTQWNNGCLINSETHMKTKSLDPHPTSCDNNIRCILVCVFFILLYIYTHTSIILGHPLPSWQI